MPSVPALDAAIALTRFGLGAGPGDIADVSHDPRAWLDGQIRPQGTPLPPGTFISTAERTQQLLDYQSETTAARRPADRAGVTMPEPSPGMSAADPASEDQPMADPTAQARFDARQASRRALTRQTAMDFLARARFGVTTDDGFAERWALFWANLLTVSATKFQARLFVGPFEHEAIRPHVFGRFEDLVVAAEQHPAMLLYLDQARSSGPNSQAGRRRNAGLNENLAREALELHTVGAASGYTQADVTELARALTGWSVPTARDQGGRRGRRRPAAMEADTNGFVFRANSHEPGERTVMGRRYAEAGVEQGEAILRDLANRPETARRVAHRIATHFVADAPPPSLVSALEQAWMESRGDLSVVARALIASPDAWLPQASKIKTPYEFILSTHRALGTTPERIEPLQQALVQMGQPAFTPPSPEGWPDTAADWAGPDALVKRLNWATTVGGRAEAENPERVAVQALGPRLGERSRLSVARAESRPEAMILFLMSPEFQSR
ncbi:DUF1800 domain-containing protein [Brevundimonas sp.]|uniref:DUF1800 domain-containing protein n=1 Tax=Brevundimonas sp. TaxID=1871086 RepID=UPI002AB98DD4|nr:DUF1800 family protein [Brevundimonas sp.]MDZ4363716.1 DUF1800 family protein [Brevundimonas sp.]